MRIANRARPARRNPWAWVPTLYLAEGIPYILVTTVSVILYKNLGISNTDIALYTSWLYLPWVMKPLWSPLVDMIRTKRFWIVLMQLLIGASLACIALTLPASAFFRYSLAIFWIMAFSSATHDIAADGFYMLGLEQYQQAAFVGVRTLFYRIAVIAAKGILVVFAGHLQSSGFSVTTAWSVTFFLGAAIFLAFALYSALVLPYPPTDAPAPRTADSAHVTADILHIFALFFRRKEIFVIVAFFLFYRFAEAQLIKMVAPFLLDPRARGGLGLTTGEVGIVYGTVGAAAVMLGGLLGGYVISRQGLKFWLWPMVLIMHLPVLVFVYLSQAQPENLLIINAAVAVEQFGYGFGFTAYSLFMIMVAEGPYKTVHYALGTGIMALGMMIPGMTSGWLQELLGYPHFFLWIALSTIPGFIVAALVKIDPAYGRKV
ncbi:MFS transporter, PAT family, beta-lactamase induction signal transducer AmpG [Syntrophus gentianae]|uniref:MFS transporter, PAT family, beta-lactamase induction signal transducer AmpG n=1 Tax=Syntrophus gentianae TaxID=43775 RepID=A0A1H7WF50_9BACT|nr:AmpG family muropeptide MFS transporter [Syntrophus gentianae]SEM19648.1 MFS transporter, PAT family, beta-lactamase induction signal transducer AmpG [Syntrophus gentianae]